MIVLGFEFRQSDCRTLGFDDSLSTGSMEEWIRYIVQNNLGMLILKKFFTITLELYSRVGSRFIFSKT